MKIQLETKGNVAVVTVCSEAIDASNAKEFKEGMIPLLEKHSQVVFDMSHLRFVDSTGLGALLSCLRELHKSNGDLRLFGMTKQVRVLFEVVNMHKVFEIFNTVEEAVASFENQ